MKLSRIARALVVACGVLASSLATGTPGAAADSFGCAAWFPNGQPWTDSGAVIITAALDCRPAPDSFLVVLQLQYRAPGTDWTTRASTRDYTIPNPRSQVGVFVDCEPGLWRGAATMWVTDKLGRQDQTVEFSSAIRFDCPGFN
ncbi:hypothetical protein ACTD5D_39645 [Nocardia takedensis]|uniref:hypothetical protein n=1 Tax=Nocardia takedensis TaxID=259390 RepID=UPI003F768887